MRSSRKSLGGMKLPRSSPKRASCASHSESPTIGLTAGTAGHILDMEGINDQGGNAGRLKMRKHALPINPGALHHDLLDAVRSQPGDQSAHVALEPAELARLARHRAVLL